MIHEILRIPRWPKFFDSKCETCGERVPAGYGHTCDPAGQIAKAEDVMLLAAPPSGGSAPSNVPALVLPKHLALYLTHNDHACVYETVERQCDDLRLDSESWVSQEQRQKAIRVNQMWSCQWYPSTPVGFFLLCAADLDVLLAALAKIARGEDGLQQGQAQPPDGGGASNSSEPSA